MSPHGTGSTKPDVAVILALALAAVLAWRRSSMLRVVAVGAAAYLVLVGVKLVV
ncbi:MAG: AzlD domain-containing protein [Actinomycetota bacterium]